MPLGKLSKKQIQQAYSVLTDLQELVKTGGSNSRFLDASNRFYTLIPHDFGVEKPPILNSEEIIKVSEMCRPFSCGTSKGIMCELSIDECTLRTLA
jgi:poly [ADP-ribose] polymerase